MSYCAHDVHCPGYGKEHDTAVGKPSPTFEVLSELEKMSSVLADFDPAIANPPFRNYTKDRSLAGKKRRKKK